VGSSSASTAPSAPSESAVTEAIDRAREQANGGDCGSALTALARVLTQSPEHPRAPEAMLLRARCFRRGGAPLRAIGELERMGRRYPSNANQSSALLEMAEAYAALGDLERSRELFGHVMRRFPRSRAASRATVRVQELGRGRRAREE
jgi:TolA-binding protein